MSEKSTYLLKQILFGGFLLMLFIPQLQEHFSLKHVGELDGSYSPVSNIDFSKEAWFAGDYQEKKAAYLSENFGFRKSLVRRFNELRYRLYDATNARGVVVGKSDVLYESWYIQSALGLDFIGEDNLKIKVNKLTAVRDTLESLGKDLLVVLAPGKGSYYPDNYPEIWYDSLRSQTNHEVFNRLLIENDLHLFDIKTWFINAKDTSQSPLFPKTGIHWSKYGEYLVMDSLIKKIEAIQNIKMTNLVLDSVQYSNVMQGTDDDIERSMNLMYDIPDYEMRYPYFRFVDDSMTQHPNVLTISDSFNWGMYNSGFSQGAYDKSEFWYYFEDVYPARDGVIVKVKDLYLKDELEKVDAVVILCTETNIYSFGFIEKAYDAYFTDTGKDAAFQRRVLYFKRLIRKSPEWFAKIVEQARQEQISDEESLQKNAEYMAWEETQE